ncbi:50S ribosomal protein L25/general stress protein Ctc [Cypionkella sp.]|uniref:50S ribosomal protein L25/general stress protein Ctc n=1 Tax=Cypionkella sp. TaxID=2811411 RepID=UPI00261DCF95|nr:50S ribosomal protein L25/general stress protein Ctc [Cypionkella sp.]MDB5665560.1 ribosomal protein [Cypionkella sp.]
MAREILDLHAEARTGTGKGAARQSRRDGFVPGIVYGDNVAPLAIKIPYNALLKRLKAGRFLSSLFNLKVEGQPDVHVICRAVQRDVVKDQPTHIDLMRLHDENRINLFIHVTFINHDASPGLKKGGTLTIVRNDVELNVLAGDIPDHITVDLTGKNMGDVIHINDVVLPEGTKASIDRNFVIANVSAPAGYVEAGEEEAAA